MKITGDDIIGIFIGNSYFSKLVYKNYELLAAAVGVIFLTLSYLSLGIIDKKISKDKKYELHMDKIIEKS